MMKLEWAIDTPQLMTRDEFDEYVANLNAKKFGGFNDWRVPSKFELRSIVNYNQINPAFNQTEFPFLKPDDYWCGGNYALDENCGWVLNLNLGATTAKLKSDKSFGIAVRGEKLPRDRFVDNGDGTITDRVLNLMWQKDQPDRKSYSDILAMLKDFELAGFKDWRLPTMQELGSIFDEDHANGSWYFDGFERDKLKPPILQHLAVNSFSGTYIWVTNFNFGYDGYYAEKNVPLCYRLVRSIESESGILDEKTGIRYANLAPDQKFTFDEAQKFVEDLNCDGKNSWRLPTVDELRMIVDYQKKSPAILEKFSTIANSDFYWTGESHTPTKSARAWAIYFGYGCAISLEKDQKCGCIVVSGNSNLTEKSGDRYEIRDEVVIDKYLKIMWYRDELPMMTAPDAEKYLAENNLAGFSGWRLPSIKELSTIFDRKVENLNWIDQKLFPHVYDEKYMFILAAETFNGCFNWGINRMFAYDGYYADRFNGKYKVRPVRSIEE